MGRPPALRYGGQDRGSGAGGGGNFPYLYDKPSTYSIMVREMVELPIAPFGRIAKKNGADRVSEEAMTRLAVLAEEHAGKLVVEAVKLCTHAGRKTIKVEDIDLALQQI